MVMRRCASRGLGVIRVVGSSWPVGVCCQVLYTEKLVPRQCRLPLWRAGRPDATGGALRPPTPDDDWEFIGQRGACAGRIVLAAVPARRDHPLPSPEAPM